MEIWCAPCHEHCATFPTPSILNSACLHIRFRYRASQMNRGLVGSIPTGRVTLGFGCVETSATSNHLAIHPLPTSAATSLSTQASNSWGTWLGSSTIGIRSAPLYAWPWYVPFLERSMNSVNLTPRNYPSRVSRLG